MTPEQFSSSIRDEERYDTQVSCAREFQFMRRSKKLQAAANSEPGVSWFNSKIAPTFSALDFFREQSCKICGLRGRIDF